MRVFKLNPQSRRLAIQAISEAPDGWMVKLMESLKTRGQEEKYHAMIEDIAKQYKHCDRLWTEEDMKRLCLDQFKRDTIKDPEFVESWQQMGQVDMAPSLDHSGVVALGVQSRRFPKKLASAFVEWLYAFGAEHGIQFKGE